MVVLGLLLMLACAALAADLVVQNTHLAHVTVFGQSVSHLSTGGVFVAGAIVGLLFALGLMMLTGGIGRRRRVRRERRMAIRRAEAEAEALREDNERLAARLDAHGTSADNEAADAYPADTAADRSLTGRHRA